MAELNSTSTPQGVGMKVCVSCGECKPATRCFFHSHAMAKDGLRKECKQCRKKESSAYYEANKARVIANAKAWQDANPEKANAKKRAWAQRNLEREKERKRTYRATNRELIRAREAERVKHREASDPCFRLRRLMSRRMWMSLRKEKNGWSWEGLVGYTRQDLKNHLERQFTKGMSWEAFAEGRIHIDHIIPVSSFSYTSPSDPGFLACWSLSNLRPLWAEDNMKKSDKLEFLI